MQRNAIFIGFLAGLSVVAGWLVSKINFIGRLGIGLLHHEFSFMRHWYKTAALFFGIWLLLFALQLLAKRRMPPATGRTTLVICIIAAIAGLLATWNNFRTDFTHRIIGEPFHMGFYLFWIGWLLISFYLLAQPNPKRNVVL